MKKVKKKLKEGGNLPTVEELQETIKKLKAELKHTKSEAGKWNIEVSQLVADRYNIMLCLYGIAKKEDGLARDYIRGIMTIPRFKEDFKRIKKMHESMSSLTKILAKVKQDE